MVRRAIYFIGRLLDALGQGEQEQRACVCTCVRAIAALVARSACLHALCLCVALCGVDRHNLFVQFFPLS